MTIDVGALAINRDGYTSWNRTYVALDNPADASGTMDTVEVWAWGSITGFRAGTFYLIGGSTYKCRDSASIGDVSPGSKQTFNGLSITIETDDYIGWFQVESRMEADYSGFAGLKYVTGEYIDPNDQTSYNDLAGDAASVYGTGDGVGEPTQQAVGGGSIAIAGVLGRNIFIDVGAGSVTIAGALTPILTFLQAVGEGAIAIAGALSIVHIMFVSVARGSIAIAGTLGRKIALAVGSGSVTIAGSLVANLTGLFFQAVGDGAVAISGVLGRLIKIGVGAGAVTIAGTINRLIKIRVGMPSLYEYYISNDDGFLSLYDTNWLFQGFTPVVSHRISSVKLKLYRVDLPGIVTISIRATSGETPIGNDLCSGTIDGDTLTTDITGTWYEISLGAGCNLDATVKYAIVIRAPNGVFSNRVYWRTDGTSPTYAGGKAGGSNNSGGSWSTAFPSSDLMFEEWGGAVAISGTLGRLIKINVGGGAVAIAGVLIRISEWIALTLKGRAFGLTLPSRTINLTLRHRNLSLTLESRTITLSLGGRSLSLTLPKRK